MTGALVFYRNTGITNSEVEILSSTDDENVTIKGFNIINLNPYPVYLKFYNDTATNVTVGTTTPKGILMIPDKGCVFENITNNGRYLNFDVALTIACTRNLADSDNTAVSGVYVELQYQRV
jgi:hypothetical protein